MNGSSQKCLLLLLAGLGLAVAGCSREARLQKALDTARQEALAQNFGAAEIDYLRVLQLNPRQPEALVGLATVYYDWGRWSVAIPLLLEAVKIAPENLDVRLKIASLYLSAGKAAEAREQAEFILSLQPAHAEALLLLVEASGLQGKLEEARQRVQTLREGAGDLAVFHCAEVLFLMNRGDFTNAAREAQTAIERDPDFDAGYLLLGDALRLQGRETEGRASMERGYLRTDPRSRRKFRWIDYLAAQGEVETALSLLEQLDREAPGYFPVLLRRARLELQQGELSESEVWLNQALAFDGGSFEALSLRGELWLAQGNTREAINLLERLVKAAPQSASLRLQLARAYVRAGDPAAALAQLNRTIELNPGQVESRLMRVEIALRMGDTSGALVWIDELLRVTPDSRAARLLEAEARRLSGSFDEAAAIYRSLLEKNSRDTESLFRLGQVRFLQKDFTEARALFEAAIEINPGHLPSLSALADMDFKDQKLSVAIERVRNLLEKNPLALGPKFLLAQIYLAQGSQGQAAEELNSIIDLAPTWRPPYLILARQYVDSGEVDSARTRLNLLLTNRPDDERAMSMLAALDEVEGKVSSAAERYEELLKTHPDNLLAMNNLAYLYSTHLPHPERAFELASAAREKQPRDASIADTFGWVLLGRGEYRRALGILQGFEPQMNRSPESAYHLGLAYYLAGMESPARLYLEAAVESAQEFFGRDDALARLAVLRMDPGRNDEPGVRLLEQALRQNAADPVALKRLASVLQARGDVAGERALYEAALEADRSSMVALLGLAEMFATAPKGQARALELAKAARLLAPKDPVVAHTLGRLAFQAGDYAWALSLLMEASNQLPQRLDILRDLGLAYYSMGRLPEAEKALQQVVQQNPAGMEEVRPFLELLAQQRSLGDPVRAKELAEAVLLQQPDNAAGRMVLGMVAERAGQPREALGYYEAVLTTYPSFAPAMRRIVLLAAGDLKEDALAYQWGAKAREHFPGDVELSAALGEVMYRRGDYRYARQLLQEAETPQSADADLLYHLGMAQYKIQDFPAAQRTLTRAVSLSPNHLLASEARQALGSM